MWIWPSKYQYNQGLASPRLNWVGPDGLWVGAPVLGVDELDGHNGSLGPQEWKNERKKSEKLKIMQISKKKSLIFSDGIWIFWLDLD